jgi:hypothetical protein
LNQVTEELRTLGEAKEDDLTDFWTGVRNDADTVCALLAPASETEPEEDEPADEMRAAEPPIVGPTDHSIELCRRVAGRLFASGDVNDPLPKFIKARIEEAQADAARALVSVRKAIVRAYLCDQLDLLWDLQREPGASHLPQGAVAQAPTTWNAGFAVGSESQPLSLGSDWWINELPAWPSPPAEEEADTELGRSASVRTVANDAYKLGHALYVGSRGKDPFEYHQLGDWLDQAGALLRHFREGTATPWALGEFWNGVRSAAKEKSDFAQPDNSVTESLRLASAYMRDAEASVVLAQMDCWMGHWEPDPQWQTIARSHDLLGLGANLLV